MADNTQVNAGTGPFITTEDIGGGVQMPVTKLDVGGHDASERVYSAGLPGTVPVQVKRDWVKVDINPTGIAAGASYLSNRVIGGPFAIPAFRSMSGGWGTIEQLIVTAPSDFSSFRLAIFLFSAPFVGTYADGSTFTMDPGDSPNFQTEIEVNTDTWGSPQAIMTSYTPWDFYQNMEAPIMSVDENFYALLVTDGGTTWPSANMDNFHVIFYIRRD